MRLSRLQGRKTADYLARQGRIWKGKTCSIHWLPGAPKALSQKEASLPSAIYAGTAASAKLHASAVVRNRMRRRVREALRLELKDRADFPTLQLLIRPRFASLSAPFADIRGDVRSFLSSI